MNNSGNQKHHKDRQMKDMPHVERPREKLLQKGANALSLSYYYLELAS